MIRPGMMLAAAVAISTAAGTAHAKMAMQTFPVLAGAGAHDVYPAAREGLPTPEPVRRCRRQLGAAVREEHVPVDLSCSQKSEPCSVSATLGGSWSKSRGSQPHEKRVLLGPRDSALGKLTFDRNNGRGLGPNEGLTRGSASHG
jgi:hypothetical protein